MLSQLLFIRLKTAENALRDGRLDEAYRLATAPDIREHRRGAAVLAKLAEQFLERARGHFRADRFTEAMIDLDRARTGGVLTEEIAELEGHVRTVAAEQQRHEQSKRERIDAARRRIEGGSLVAGRKILERAGEEDHAAKELRHVADDRAEEVARILEQVERLIGQGRMATAAERLRRAKAIDAHNEGVIRVETQLCNRVLENTRAAIQEGKLSRAADELDCLGDVGKALPARRELVDVLALARDAARYLTQNRYPDARRQVMSLGRLLPDAEWVREATEQLRQIDDITTALLASPLGDRIGLLAARDKADRVGDARRRPRGEDQRGRTYAEALSGAPVDDTVALPARVRTSDALPERLLLLVDGGGSYLILRGDHVSLGRVASGHPADVPFFSDVAERHANVNRVDEDYFLFADKEVEVAGQRARHQLLRNGDRIVLGRKAKLTFRVPSRKSPTAVLDLSDTTKMPNDVRRVVLFHRHATLGAGPSAHIRCQHAGPPLILFDRNGTLWLRQKNDGHVDTEAIELRLGEPIEIAGASLVLQPWELRAPGMRAT